MKAETIAVPIEIRVAAASKQEIETISRALEQLNFNISGLRPDKFDPTRFVAYFTARPGEVTDND